MTTTPIQVTAFEIHKAIALDGVELDPIRVILHDIKPGEGRLIIECYGDSWSTYWGGMGQYRIMQFVCEADVDYVTSRMLNSDGTQAQKAQQEKYLRRIVHAVKEALRERHCQEITERYAVGSQWLSESSGIITVTAFHTDHLGDGSGMMRLYFTTEHNGGGHMGKNHIEELKPYMPQQLPDKAGFYWWRKTQTDEWRMVQIVDFGGGMLCAYDIEFQKWSGRSMEAWKKHDPSGYWIAIGKPVGQLNGACAQRDKLVELLQGFLSQTRMGDDRGMFVKPEEFDQLGIALGMVLAGKEAKHAEIIPPLDCPHDELVAYIKSMKGGERVMEMGESGMKGCTGRVVIKDESVCIQWDRRPGEMGVMTTSFTGGARIIPQLTKEEWLSRCAARFVERAGVSSEIALDMANAQLENLEFDLAENPEDAADEEMSNWPAE